MGRSAAIVGVVVCGLSAAAAGSVLMLGVSRAEGGDQGKGVIRANGRLELEAKPDCFTVRFFIKNEGEEVAEIVYGYGHGGQELVPTIHIIGENRGPVSITPPIYRYSQARHLNPDTLRIPAHQEVLYGTYTMGYPPEDRIARGHLMIRADFLYQVRGQREPRLYVQTEPLPFPPPKAH